MSRRLILGVVLFALVVGYVEMRLPAPVRAQGRDAVYQRLATGVLAFETALTPTMTGRLAATGTASEATFLRGDGTWAALQDVYWDWTLTRVSTTSNTTWSDAGLGFSITTSATNTVILDIDLAYIYRCSIRVTGGTSELASIVMTPSLDVSTTFVSPRITDLRAYYGNSAVRVDYDPTNTPGSLSVSQRSFDSRLVDTPGTGTHAYKVQVRQRLSSGSSCTANSPTNINTFTAQVLP